MRSHLMAVLAASVLGLYGCNSGSSSSPASASVPALSGAGAMAAEALQSGPGHESLVVYVDWTPGRQPAVSTLELLELRLAERCNKPGGVQVRYGGELSGPFYTVYEPLSLEALARTAPPREATPLDAIVFQVIFVNGVGLAEVGEDDKLGVSFSANQVAVFSETVATHAPRGENLEGAVALHEMGHLLGLVNLGVPTVFPHADPRDPAHCVNNGCLMTARSNNWGLRREATPDFCSDCKADLAAFGGR